jgi:hypothetical protein
MFTRFDSRWARVVSALAVVLAFGQATGLRARQAPAVKDIIARHVAAMGGEAAFKALKSIHAVGTFSMPAQGISGSVEFFMARPNKQLMKTSLPSIGNIDSGFDGKVGWSIDAVTGPTLFTGKQLLETQDDAWFDGPLHASDHVKAMEVVGNETFDKRPAVKVKVVFASGNEQFEYFDTETGLQIGYDARRETSMGALPMTGYLRNYQKLRGVLFPMTMVQKGLGIEQIIEFKSVTFDDVPPETFDLPPAIKALIK